MPFLGRIFKDYRREGRLPDERLEGGMKNPHLQRMYQEIIRRVQAGDSLPARFYLGLVGQGSWSAGNTGYTPAQIIWHNQALGALIGEWNHGFFAQQYRYFKVICEAFASYEGQYTLDYFAEHKSEPAFQKLAGELLGTDRITADRQAGLREIFSI